MEIQNHHEMVSPNQPKNYNGIDLAKFFCAVMVFVIHIAPFDPESFPLARYLNFGLQQYLCRLAVPFFFVSSGFFLFKKMPPHDDLNKEAIKNYCFKILRLLGTWTVLLFWGGTWHLWYLGATVIAVILLSLCFHFRMRFKHIAIVACLLYIIGLLGDSYYGVVEPLARLPVIKYIFTGYNLMFQTTRNGVFMGFIFILMGAAFSRCKISLKPQTSVIGFVASVICLFAEVFLLKYHDIPIDYNMYVFLLPAVFFLFSFASTVKLKDRTVYKRLRNIGMLIYFSHVLVIQFVSTSVIVINKYWHIDAAHYQFIISLFFTVLIAVCVDWLSCKDRFKWLKFLFL